MERLSDERLATQVDKLLADYEGITRERYAAGLASFRVWYAQSYAAEPNAALLTAEEVRDYRVHLTGVKGYKADTVNTYLAPIRTLVRAQGRTLKVKGVKQVQGLMETLDARDLGRLINAVDGPQWSDKRNVALINVMARAMIPFLNNPGDLPLCLASSATTPLCDSCFLGRQAAQICRRVWV